jgi:fumarate hydratase class II
MVLLVSTNLRSWLHEDAEVNINPTKCVALVVIGIQVIGNDTAVAFAGSQGNFKSNALPPIIIKKLQSSARILADGCE